MHASVGKKLKMLITNVYTFKKKSTFTADNLQYIRLSKQTNKDMFYHR